MCQLRINDIVLYGTHGACVVADIEQKAFGNTVLDYYVLKPVDAKSSTIYVPTGNQKLLSQMRQVLSAEEIYALIRSMPEEEPLWVEDEPARKELYRQIIQQGDRKQLVAMAKALYAHQQKQAAKGKRLHIADEGFLRDAEKMLYSEFSLVLNIQPQQVLPFILMQIDLQAKENAPLF